MSARPAGIHEENRAAIAARQVSEERFRDSAPGLLETARELLFRASQMTDTNDRNTILRMAAGYQRRAEEKRNRQSS